MNLLITGAWKDANEYIPELETSGHRVHFLQWEKDPLPCSYEWVEGMVCGRLFSYHPIEQFVNLRYIQLTSAGTDHMPLDYIREHGIKLHNARGVYSIPMAEYAVSGVLQLYKHTRQFSDNQKNHRWEKIRELPELYGKTVCIIGCGSVGQECAKRFQAFGCRVIGVSRRIPVIPGLCGFNEIFPASKFNEILIQADIVILSLPLTEASRYLINKSNLACLRQSAILVNLSRGALVETAALREALSKRNIGGAVLDVFEEEPLSEYNPLWDVENLILTPHNSYVGEGNEERLWNCIQSNLEGSVL